MTLVDKDKMQRDAASLVVAELGAVRFEERDVPGAPPGTRDFDIIFPDGHCEPLEVTSNLDRVVMNALGRTGGGYFELPARVRRFWGVSASQTYTDASGKRVPFDPRRVAELLTPLIEELDAKGETRFAIDELAWPVGGPGLPSYEQPARELHALGVVQGLSAAAGEDGPRVMVSLSGGGSWGPPVIPGVLGKIAALPDNIAKIEPCRQAERRHLFVVLVGSGSTDWAGWALRDYLRGWIWEGEEPGLPELPDAITTVWASSGTGGIYATPPEEWKRFGDAVE